jgi:hypothetical protein
MFPILFLILVGKYVLFFSTHDGRYQENNNNNLKSRQNQEEGLKGSS